jgi:hypothetical protein
MIFCERLPPTFLGVAQQRTHAVWHALTAWGWSASAAGVARVATEQGVPLSADTVLRALRAYPTLRRVKRDRNERWARAIAAGAPAALPGTDRFPRRQHRRQVLERVGHHGVGTGRPAAAPAESPSPPPTTAVQHRPDLGTRIPERVAAGDSLRGRAQPLKRDRATVRQDARAATCPMPPSRSPASRALAGWTDRVEALGPAGEHHRRRLGAAVPAEDCSGRDSAVHRWLVRHHPRSARLPGHVRLAESPTPRQGVAGHRPRPDDRLAGGHGPGGVRLGATVAGLGPIPATRGVGAWVTPRGNAGPPGLRAGSAATKPR